MASVARTFVHVLKTILFFLIGMVLPDKGKRILVLTSLYRRMVVKGVFQEEMLAKLNDTLHLAESEAVIDALPPTTLSHIWENSKLDSMLESIDGDSTEPCLPFSEVDKLSEQIVAMVPGWLRYDTLSRMREDTARLFFIQPVRHVCPWTPGRVPNPSHATAA